MRLTILCLAIGFSGSQPVSAKVKNGVSKILVKSISIEHTNPSMGPHEKIRTFSLSNTPEHKSEFDTLLDKGTVFEFSFREFIRATLDNDRKVLDKVQAGKDKTDRNDLPEGGTISNLTIYLEDKGPVQLRDLRYYRLGGSYHAFISYLVQKGSKSENSGRGDPQPEELKVIQDNSTEITIEDRSTKKPGK